MPVFLLFAAVLLFAAGVNDKTSELTGLLKGDFSPQNGKPGFMTWVLAIFAIGALGYIKPLKPVSIAFLTLLFVVFFLTNGTGFFSRITSLLNGQVGETGITAGGGSFGGAGASLSF